MSHLATFPLTEVIGHHPLISKRLLCAYRDNRLTGTKCIKSQRLSMAAAPSDLFLNVVKERDSIAKAVLNVNVSKCQ